MTSKVLPLVSDHSVCPLSPHQRDSKGMRGSTDSVEHYDESVDVHLVHNEEIAWIRENIKMRCTSTTSKDKANDVCSTCRNKNSDHEPIACSQQKQEAMSPSAKDTYQYRVPTNAFGEIEFVGFGNIGKFIRVDIKINRNTLLDLMEKEWGTETPNLIISVTGSAKYSSMKPDLRDVFQRGLMKAARSTGAWIVTGGTYTGVMKYVGEAVQEYGLTSATQKPVVAIGIAPWGIIRNRNNLENNKGSWPAQYRIEKHLNRKESFLDPNHSHFILVDDGTQNTFETEIPFRAKLERKMSRRKNDTGDDNRVPIVILVLEGGKGTLKTVHQALKKHTPAVIVKGSGRAADILAYAFNRFTAEDKHKEGQHCKRAEKQMKWNLKDDLAKQMKDIDFCPETEIDDNIVLINECLDKSDKVHVIEWDSGTAALDIEKAILKVLLQVNKDQLMNQLEQILDNNKDQNNKDQNNMASLTNDVIQTTVGTKPSATQLNRVNFEEFCEDHRVSLNEFLSIERLLRQNKNSCGLDNILRGAIQQNSVNFVKLFLDYGVSLKEFLKDENLLWLYENPPANSFLKVALYERFHKKNEEVPSRCFLRILLDKMCPKKKENSGKQVTLNEVGQLIQDLLGDNYVPKHFSDTKTETESCERKESLEEKSDHETANSKAESLKPEWKLFIWSVLSNQQGMAKLFWLYGKMNPMDVLKLTRISVENHLKQCTRVNHSDQVDNIAAALVANALLHAMSNRTKDTDLIAQNTANASEFMELAIEVLNKCYSADKKETHDLLIRELPQWKNKTSCVLIAMNENNEEFISQPACRDLMDNIWMGKLTKEKVTWKVSVKEHLHLRQETKDDSTRETCRYMKRLVRVIIERFTPFYSAPVVIFIHNVIFYMVFLGLYSYILICKINEYVSLEEGVLIVWVSAIFIQEVKQVSTALSGNVRARFKRYRKDPWNILDVITIVLFAIGMVLRRIEVGRVFLGVNLITFFLRLLHIFSVHKELGPKLVMIYRMVIKLAGFALILFTFIVAYAVSSYSILYPNTELNIDTFMAVFRRPYWNIYGELMLNEIEGAEDCTNDAELYRNGTYPRCPTVSGKYVVPVLMGLYMLICTILLLNLLIAIFSDTYQEVQGTADMLWCFHRLKLINEYCSRSCLPPPIMLLVYVVQFIRYIVRKCCCDPVSSTQEIDVFCHEIPNEEKCRQFENVMANKFYRMMKPADQESINNRLEMRSKTGTESVITDIAQKMENMEKRSSSDRSKVQRMERLSQAIQPLGLQPISCCIMEWIVKSLREHRLGASDATFEESKEEENKSAEACHMLEGEEKIHTRCRISPYPETNIQRFKVPDDKVPWDVEFPKYTPPTYTSRVVSAKPVWADKVDIYEVPVAEIKLQFNAFDSVTNTKRYSYEGKYRVQNGKPLNPMGRTGLQCRGNLGRWGPNHYVNSVITRWKYDQNNVKMMKDGKPQFEFVAVRRSKTEPWTLPESILTPGRPPTKHLNIKFSYEDFGQVGDDKKQKKEIKKQKKRILKKGQLIHKGYADDPRNTDNAWVESTVYLYQDKKNVLRHYLIKTTVPDHEAKWLVASSELTLDGAHSYFLKLVAETMDASF